MTETMVLDVKQVKTFIICYKTDKKLREESLYNITLALMSHIFSDHYSRATNDRFVRKLNIISVQNSTHIINDYYIKSEMSKGLFI